MTLVHSGLARIKVLLFWGLSASHAADLRQDTLDGWRYFLPVKYQEVSRSENPGSWSCRKYTPGGNASDDHLLEVCAGPWNATDSSDRVFDHPNMGRESGNWYGYGYGYGEKTPAQKLSVGSTAFGWDAVVQCGISNRSGFHAAGGESYGGFVVRDSQHVLSAEFSALPLERVPKQILWVRKTLLSARR